MKRLVLLIISVFIGIVASADGVEYFEHIKSLYQQGRYEEAKQGFVSCKTYYSDELNVSSINEWISLCQSKINERNVAIQARRQAEIAEAKRKANEAKQQERIEKKLLYVSSNAFIFIKEYTGMHQAIKGYIAENSEQRFTDDPEMAYWCIYITANAHEYSTDGSGIHYSNVVAYIKITNEITKETIYESEVIVKGGSSMNYTVAAEKAYRNANKDIGIRIVEQLK